MILIPLILLNGYVPVVLTLMDPAFLCTLKCPPLLKMTRSIHPLRASYLNVLNLHHSCW